MGIYERLLSRNISLPPLTAPVAAFVPVVCSGSLLFASGHIAKRDGKPYTGQLGRDLSTAEGVSAARSIGIDLLGTMHGVLGDLEKIRQIVKVTVLVNSSPTFVEHHIVANGASELFVEVFGDRGKHVRAAFGVAQIPFGSCVEVELIAELKEWATVSERYVLGETQQSVSQQSL